MPTARAAAQFAAVILAGGRGRRLGGADKPGLLVGSAPMAAIVARAVADAGARRVVVVGPHRPELTEIGDRVPGGLAFVREEPPGAGPVPALRAGLAVIAAPWVVVLAADLPFLRAQHVQALLDAAGAGTVDGAVLIDDGGSDQWLLSCWSTRRLRAALAGYGGQSAGGLLGPLEPARLSWPAADGRPAPWRDCDTEAELAQARRAAAGPEHSAVDGCCT
jgi:molybdopterin-guanine dinucleotide biosynthesis protein A